MPWIGAHLFPLSATLLGIPPWRPQDGICTRDLQSHRQNIWRCAHGRSMAMPFVAWLIFIVAAILEVGGDALIRQGLRGDRLAIIVAGCLTLGGYGLVVNMVKWDFAKLLGVYVALFAVVSVCVGRFVFKEHVPLATWLGLSLIIVGALVIQVSHESQ